MAVFDPTHHGSPLRSALTMRRLSLTTVNSPGYYCNPCASGANGLWKARRAACCAACTFSMLLAGNYGCSCAQQQCTAPRCETTASAAHAVRTNQLPTTDSTTATNCISNARRDESTQGNNACMCEPNAGHTLLSPWGARVRLDRCERYSRHMGRSRVRTGTVQAPHVFYRAGTVPIKNSNGHSHTLVRQSRTTTRAQSTCPRTSSTAVTAPSATPQRNPPPNFPRAIGIWICTK